MGSAVGSVATLWRFPVKSMLGEEVAEVAVTDRGVVGDRAYALLDTATGKLATGKSTRQFPDLLGCRAAFVEPPTVAATPPVQITLPDGTIVTSGGKECDAILSSYFGRDVRLISKVPAEYAEGQASFFQHAGLAAPVTGGLMTDLYPLSVLTTSTLAQLALLAPDSQFDVRRFRMNIIVETDAPGFPENDWLERRLEIGGNVRAYVAVPDPRCVMTTLAQDGLPSDPAILRTLAEHVSVPVGGIGSLPCAGVYATVESTGLLRKGEPIVLR